MDFDWDNAAVKVLVPVHFTAGHEIQEFTLPLSSFARLLLTSVPAEWFAQPPVSANLPLHIDPGPPRSTDDE